MRALWILSIIQLMALIDAKTIASGGQRIVGGTVVTDNIPYLVVVRVSNSLCGGSLVNGGTHVVTAAHCVYGRTAASITIRAGTKYMQEGGLTSAVTRINIHPNYNTSNSNMDVAILKLTTPFSETKEISSIPLGTAEPPNGAEVTVAGWGRTSEAGSTSNVAQEVTVPLVARMQCRKDYSDQTITMAMICAGSSGKDACHGDSGGPLTYNGKLCGIVSWGIGCARPNMPGVYTNVAAVNVQNFINNWINK